MSGWFEITYPAFLNTAYTLVLLGALFMAIQMLAFTYIYVLKARFKVFNGKYLKSFEEEHKQAFPGT